MKTTANSKNCLKPIQLLRFDENKKLILTQQAIELFNRIQSSQLSIVTVAGRYRTGKSYILNRVLLSKNSGFEVGPTINACTKGLWIWPEIVKIQNNEFVRDCLIIDTQGLGSLEEGENTDMKIFLMALLLSSYFIYNSVGSIDEKAIENLGLVTNLAQLLFKDGNIYDSQELINSFPSFMWLVRDFSLRLENQNGQPISSQDYLENALKYQKIKNNGSDHKNQIRKQLKTFFPERNCFTLIRPTQNERDLQNLSILSEQRLRPQFVKLIKQFKQSIHSNIKPKKIKGKSITPQGFIELCKYYVDTINSGKLPAINSHWDNLCIREASRIIEHYRNCHYSKLSNNIEDNKETDYNLNKVKEIHKKEMKEAFEKIEKSFLGKLQKQLSKERLQKFLNEIYQQIVKEISDKRSAKVQDIVKEIFEEIVIQFKSSKLETFDEIFEKFQQIKENYKNETRIYESFYQNSKDVFQAFLQNLEQYWEQKQLVLIEKNQYLQSSIEKKTMEMKEKIEKSGQLIRQLEQKVYKAQLINGQLKKKNQDLIEKIEEKIKQNNELKDRIEEYEEKLEQKKEKQLNEVIQKMQQKLEQKSKQAQHMNIQLAKNEEIVRQMSIKERKMQREMEIFKNKCSQYLKENIRLNENIEELNKTLFEREQERRKQQLHLIKGETDQIPQIISALNQKIDELNFTLKGKENQISTLTKRLHDEKSTNETLLKTPQNINMMSLKKSYQLELQNNSNLSNKLLQNERVFSLCSFTCSICKKKIDKSSIGSHVKSCSETKMAFFDVSYQLNGNGDMEFVIDVRVDDSEWMVRKSIQNIKLLLSKLRIESQIFIDVKNDDDVNYSEDRRIFLDDLFNGFERSVWDNSYLIQFFAIDIHYLNQKQERSTNSMKSSKLSLQLDDLMEENIEPQSILMRTTKFSRKVFNFGPQML